MDLQQPVIKLLALSAACAIIAACGVQAVRRIAAERTNRSVALCADFSAILDAASEEGFDPAAVLRDLKEAGMTAISIDEETVASLRLSGTVMAGASAAASLRFADAAGAERFSAVLRDRYGLKAVLSGTTVETSFYAGMPPTWYGENMAAGFSPEKLAMAKRAGLQIVLRPRNEGDPRWAAGRAAEAGAILLFDGRELPGYPGKTRRLASAVNDAALDCVIMEFAPVTGREMLMRAAPRRLIRGHTILPQELARPVPPAFWLRRWRRAVEERGIRFLLVARAPQWKLSEYVSHTAGIRSLLNNAGFTAGPAVPPAYPVDGPLTLRMILIVIAAVGGPLAGLLAAQRLERAPLPLRYLAVNAVALGAALVIAAMLFDLRFMQKIVPVPSVKLMMLAPLCLSALIMLRDAGWRKLLNRPVSIGMAALGGAALLTIAVMVVRSGNYAPEWIRPEQGMRDWLEAALSVRPRTREFLFGQPLLIAGLYFRRRWLVWLGMIGPISMINTFLHAHTPVTVSLVRCLNGMWLGAVTGFLIIAAIRAMPGGAGRSMRSCLE